MKKLYFFLLILSAYCSNQLNAQINISNSSSIACVDTLYSSGGALGNYGNNENFVFVINPPGVDYIDYFVDWFFLEAGDTLFIYDGADTNSTLIYMFNDTSVVNPVTIASSGNSLTIQFKSDTALNDFGFRSQWYGRYTLFFGFGSPVTTVSCVNDTTTVEATIVGGLGETIQWFYNATPVGTNSTTYLATALNNLDSVWFAVSDSICPYYVDTSLGDLFTISPLTTASVSVAADDSDICAGTNVTFTATPTNGGTTPTYSWTLNGGPVGTNSNTYMNSTLNNNDIVKVTMASDFSGGCLIDSISEDSVVMTVQAYDTASISFTTSDSIICAGTLVSFTGTPLNQGGSPVYSWTVNGSPVGTNSPNYSSSSLTNNAIVKVTMASSIATGCLVDSISTDSIVMGVTASTTASVSVVADDSDICAGTNVTFTATPINGGTTPTYSWTLNGGPVGTNSNTYMNSTLNNNDIVKVTMASDFSGGCLIDSISSDSVVMTVTANTTASVSVSASDPSVCAGTSVTFTATPTNGGGSPTYSWRLNGSPVGTNSPTYINSSLSDNDYVAVTLASGFSGGCLIDSISADSVQMNINPNPSASIPSSTDLICNGINTGSATAMGTGGTELGTYDFLWDDGLAQTTATAGSLAAGTYIVTVTDDSLCFDTASVLITEPTAISISFVVTDVSTFGGNDGEVEATVSGGTPFTSGQNGYYHSWSSGQGTGYGGTRRYVFDIVGLASNWYTDTITDFNGCVYYDSAFVDQPTLLQGGEIRITGLTNKPICDEAVIGLMSQTAAAVGGVGTLVLTWQYSTDLLNWTNFPTSNSINYTYNDTITKNTFIRRRVVDAAINTAFSNLLFLNYIADQNINIIGLSTNYCENDDRDVLFGSPASPGTGTFVNANWINPGTKEFIPDSANAAVAGIYNVVTYNYTDQFGCFSTGSDSARVFTITTGTIGISQAIFDQSDTVAILTDSFPFPGGTFTGTGVYKVGATWLFNPALVPSVPFVQQIQFQYTNPNGCTTRDSIEVRVQSTEIVLTTNISTPTEFKSCYYDSIGTLYADIPFGDTVTQYRWLIQDMSTGRFYLEDNLAFTFGAFTNTTISTTFDPKNFLPIASGLPYDVIGATPFGLTSLRVYFQHSTTANPFNTNLVRENFELVHMAEVFINPNQINSNGTFGTPLQYCVDVDSVGFSSTVYPLGARPTTQVYSMLPVVPGQINDMSNGNSRFYPTVSGAGNKSITLVYTDNATGCSHDTTYPITIDVLPVVSLVNLPAENCANDGIVSFYGSPYVINEGNFSSPTAVALGLTHINGDSSASINATTLNTGNHTMHYEFTETTGCMNSDSFSFDINPLPLMALTLNPSGFSNPAICISDTNELLVFGTVNSVSNTIGDSIVGPGITYPNPATNLPGQATFNPSVAGAGSHTIRFYYTDMNGCTNYVDGIVTVNALPNASFITSTNDYNTCMVAGDNLNFTYSGGATGTSVYRIDGAVVTSFQPVTNPNIDFGTNEVVHRFAESVTTCVNSDTITITVDTFPVVAISGINATYCFNNATINYTGSPFSPGTAGGNTPSYFFSGLGDFNFTDTKTLPGQNSGSFVADSTHIGIQKISYNYTDSITGCFNGDTVDVEILDIPVLSIKRGDFPNNPLIHCLGDPIPYVPHINGIPDAGSYYLIGPGFLDSTSSLFYPDTAGVSTGPSHHTITYGTNDVNGCFNEIDSMVIVLPTSDASFSVSDSVVCVEPNGTVTITPNFVGGNFSTFYYHGTAKTASPSMDFHLDSASIGNNIITYVFDDGTGCSDTVAKVVFVNDTPDVAFEWGASYENFWNWCYNQGQVRAKVDAPSVGSSYFRSWHSINSGPKVFNNMINPNLLASGNDSVVFIPNVTVAGLPLYATATNNNDIFIDYIHVDANGCEGISSDFVFINPLPVLSITYIDTINGIGQVSTGNVCALQERMTLTGVSDLVSGLPNGYFSGSIFGTTNALVSTDSNSLGEYGPVPVDSFMSDTVYYEHTNVNGCYNSTFRVLSIKKLPPVSFTVDSSANPFSPKNICPDNIGETSSLYDDATNCLGCNLNWPASNLTRRWYVNDSSVATVSAKRFTPGVDSTVYNGFNFITQQMWDTRWAPNCYSEYTDTIFLDTFPVVDIMIDSLYCSNQGNVTFIGSPASPGFTGVGIPSYFSSTDMFGTFSDTLTALGEDSTVINTNGLAIATTGLSRTYNIRYTHTDPFTACRSFKQETFVFKTKPTLNLISGTKVFCPYQDSTAIQVFVNNIPSAGVGDSIVAKGISGNVSSGVIYYKPSNFKGDTLTQRDPITYYHTDREGCSDVYVDSNYLVRAQPILNLFIDTTLVREDSVCFNSPAANLVIQFFDTTANDFVDYGSLSGPQAPGDDNWFAFQVDDVSFPVSYSPPYTNPTSKVFNPRWDSKNDTSGVSTSIRFMGTYNSVGGCVDTIYDTIVTHPKPVGEFFLDGTCSKYSPVMHATGSYIDTLIPPFSPSDGIKKYLWKVDDSVATTMAAGAGDTLVDYNYPYALSVGKHDISVTVVSNKDCSSDLLEKEITFVASPTANFDWNLSDECEGGSVTFFTKSTIPSGAQVSWSWLFGDGNTSTDSGVTVHSFDSALKYTVTLELQDGIDCRDTMVKDIYIRPVIDTFPYLDGFSMVYSGWSLWDQDYDEEWINDTATNIYGYKPTWFEWGSKTNGSIRTRPGDPAWFIGYNIQGALDADNGEPRYEHGIQTSVISPCFDLTASNRPMLTIETIRNLETNDGVVLQYTTEKNKPLDDVKWENVGEYYRKPGTNVHYETGINWYSKDNIFGSPGKQSDLQGKIGWTDTSTQWKESRNDIDALDGESYVRFRVAFGSSLDAKGEGFAFDNFGIRERNKNIVFENFTNASAQQNKGVMETYDAVVTGSKDILDIQYHTSFPGSDPMNRDNTSDPSARVVYYGISEVPYLHGDGTVYSDFVTAQSFGFYTLKPRSLEDPKFAVNMAFDISNNTLKTDVVPISEEFLGKSVDVIVHIALVEKAIPGSTFGNLVAPPFLTHEFKNTLKRLYPTGAGTTYTGLTKGDVKTISTEILYDNFYGSDDNFKLIAFVQDKNTKEIYQGNWVDSARLNTWSGEPEYNDIVPGSVEYTLYPNPTNGLANMKFENSLESNYQLNIFNQVGVLVGQEIIPNGTTQYSFDIGGLTPGMYFIMLNDGDHKVAIKKLMLSK